MDYLVQFVIFLTLLQGYHLLYIQTDVNNVLERSTRCTRPECDSTGALSYCGNFLTPCNPGHEDAPNSYCTEPGKKCCRTACGGPQSYCFAEGTKCLPGHSTVPGKCPVQGFRCCSPKVAVVS